MFTKLPRSRRKPRKPRTRPNLRARADRAAGRPSPDDCADRFRVPPSMATEKRVFVACHYCGYGPPTVPEDGVCPKCGGRSWERFALAAKFLQR